LPERTPKNCGLQRSSVILKAEAALLERVWSVSHCAQGAS